MRQAFATIEVKTGRAGLFEFTRDVEARLDESGIRDGLVTLYVTHTSASLVIQEAADPDVVTDLEAFFRRLVPEDSRLYTHTAEGPDDMPAHIRSALTATHLSIPLRDGALQLGTWQGVYLFEHRRGRSPRRVELHVIGE